ncbi:MAG: tetratricopeptide repeat protein, partial [Pirellulaceae bacterium]|nr:tetratricopeptide repeat protein [Pirellulaceae bacterium]
SEALLESVLDGNRTTHGPQDAITAKSEFQLGILKGKRGDYATAEPLLKQALETQTLVLGKAHRSTQRTAFAYAQLLDKTQRSTAANQLRQDYTGARTARAPSLPKQ